MSKPEALFKPTASQIKGDATTRAAWAIIETSQAANLAKTERLKAARLMNEAQARAAAEVQSLHSTAARVATKAKAPPRRKGLASGAR